MDVIQSVDVDAAPLTASEVFQLRQAKTEEVVPIIEDIILGKKKAAEEMPKSPKRTHYNANIENNNAPITLRPPLVLSRPTVSIFKLRWPADERTNAIVADATGLKDTKELIEKIAFHCLRCELKLL